MAPASKAWFIKQDGPISGPDSIELRDVKVPELGSYDVLIKIQAASLNYRDFAIVSGSYPRPFDRSLIQGSDAAGEVVAIGDRVRDFAVGDKVANCFFRDYVGGELDVKSRDSTLSSEVDGAFTQYMVASTHSIVHAPKSLSVREASTLPCAALTAWSCLYGDRPMKPGDSVLVQGTGGVSLFALQFAVAAGVKVIATTSSKSKEDFLYKLGASHVINYRDNPKWGDAVRAFVPEGVTYVIEVGGQVTFRESIKSVKMEGAICIVGFLGGVDVKDQPTVWEARAALAKLRPIYVGSRAQFEDMNRAIDAAGIKPIIDDQKFGFENMVQAYRHLGDAKHIGKVVVDVN